MASLPDRVRWSHIGGAGILAGIGFTMSIFIDGLAFEDVERVNQAKIGIVAGSLVAGVVGYGFLKWVARGAGAEG
jgi:NhaA family Na+:H+ antiporter